MSHTQEAAHKTEGSGDRRRTEFMGLRGVLWMSFVWIIVILAIAFPFPWFGW